MDETETKKSSEEALIADGSPVETSPPRSTIRLEMNVPAITCLRCRERSPLIPLQVFYGVPETKNQPEGFEVNDDTGGVWRVLAAQRPAGWTSGPSTKLHEGLCPKCAQGLADAMNRYVEEFKPEPVPVVEDQQAKLLPPVKTMIGTTSVFVEPKSAGRVIHERASSIIPPPKTWG